jgi:hypothetical protein
MHCSRTLAMLTSAALTVGLAWGQAKTPRQPASSNSTAHAKPRPALTTPGPAVSPATVNFSATNPGALPSVLGSPITTFTYTSAPAGSTGQLNIAAAGFTGGAACGNIPASAVTVTCTSATASPATCATASCIAGSPSLSTTPVPIASGTVPAGSCTPNITYTLNFNFADNWKYTAETCTLVVTYTLVGS